MPSYTKKDNNCIWAINISVVIANGHSYVMHRPTGQKDEPCVTTLDLDYTYIWYHKNCDRNVDVVRLIKG